MGVMARAMRMYYEATTTLSGMWYGNPVLTSVIIGLPLGFLSLICYSMWCADIMDASEDEQSNNFQPTENHSQSKATELLTTADSFFFSFRQMFEKKRTRHQTHYSNQQNFAPSLLFPPILVK